MAIFANTTADVSEYVVRKDPARGNHKPKWIDDRDQSKGEILTPSDIETFKQDGATVFKVQPLDVFLMGYIFDRASVLRGTTDKDIDIHTRMNQTNIDAVRFGLVGIENFPTRDGGFLAFEQEDATINGREYRVAKPMVLTAIRDIEIIKEIADRIRLISEVTVDTEKKSGSALSHQG